MADEVDWVECSGLCYVVVTFWGGAEVIEFGNEEDSERRGVAGVVVGDGLVLSGDGAVFDPVCGGAGFVC